MNIPILLEFILQIILSTKIKLKEYSVKLSRTQQGRQRENSDETLRS